uniref:Uncharacterized protein n=1 Tax=Avena sativa TaxID=4498 RepID=A0ACD5TBK8_AVESA
MTKLVCIFLLLLICSLDNVSTAWCHKPYIWGEMQFKTSASSNGSLASTEAVPLYNKQNNHFAGYNSYLHAVTLYYGATGTLDVYESLSASDGQIGSSIMVAMFEEPHMDTINIIQVGWNIQPSYYGDNKTHFLIGWTSDGYLTTGCFDLKCNGFVLDHKNSPITPGDTLDGKSKISLKIFKSKDTGDWWLHFAHAGQKFAPVGYWPKSLFNALKFYANYVSWGGYVTTYDEEPNPPMGNGNWPGPDSAQIQDMQFIKKDETSYRPGPVPGLSSRVTDEACYKVSDFMIDHFSYGGPGGCTNS